MWVFVRPSTNFAHLASFQAIEFVDWSVLKMLDIFVRQASKNKAFKTQPAVREEREQDLIPTPVSTLSATNS